MHFMVRWQNALLLSGRNHFAASLWTWQAPHPRLLPSPCGYVYLGTGTQQLGRSLPLSGCLACPGLEAIVICYCSEGGEGRMEVLLTASHHPLFYRFSWALLKRTSVVLDFWPVMWLWPPESEGQNLEKKKNPTQFTWQARLADSLKVIS